MLTKVYVLLITQLPILSIHFINTLSSNRYIRYQVLHTLSHVIDEEVFRLTCEVDKTVSKYPGGSRYMYYA